MMEDFKAQNEGDNTQAEIEGATGPEPNGGPETETGYEFVHKQLKNVGKKARYRGGFKLHEGSQKYRRMSWAVADYGLRHGINLLRKTGGTTSHLMMPLPAGEFLSIADTLAYKHNKNLPSVSLIDTSKTAQFLTCYANERYGEGSKFWMLTLPAGNGRCGLNELHDAVGEAFKQLKILTEVLSDAEHGWIDILYAQLETPYREGDRTFYPHFHIILETSSEDQIAKEINELLVGYAAGLSLMWSSVSLKPVSKEKFSAVAYYCTKPSQTAFQLAEADHPAEFEEYISRVSKRRMTRSMGGFQRYKSTADRNGQKPGRVYGKGDVSTLKLVDKETRRQDGPKNLPDNSNGATEVEGTDALGGLGAEERICDQHDESHERVEEANVFCGVSTPAPAPGDRLISYSVVKNFRPSEFRKRNRCSGQFNYDEANGEALTAWENNTGQEYSLKKFLEPFAEELARTLEGGNVPYYTITLSLGIKEALAEIMAERKPKDPEFRDPKSEPQNIVESYSVLSRLWEKAKVAVMKIHRSLFGADQRL
ncbi:hypothetical protein EBB79_02950 [Parasedimentitalea marina]|uniref:Replication protein n=1 Tax=Parasedimentitalea marina TaxID=2483033 RepID=A0A3T0MYW3_9RHOB|nr:hypothetical protein [Parasedimentitalea marina]AZV76954.1 hypothetical protein EBB79_02950 [Parasedimentitalea marina]